MAGTGPTPDMLRALVWVGAVFAGGLLAALPGGMEGRGRHGPFVLRVPRGHGPRRGAARSN